MSLVQLPNGSWQRLSQVDQIVASNVDGSPRLIIASKNVQVFSIQMETIEEAEKQRDQLAEMVAAAEQHAQLYQMRFGNRAR